MLVCCWEVICHDMITHVLMRGFLFDLLISIKCMPDISWYTQKNLLLGMLGTNNLFTGDRSLSSSPVAGASVNSFLLHSMNWNRVWFINRQSMFGNEKYYLLLTYVYWTITYRFGKKIPKIRNVSCVTGLRCLFCTLYLWSLK